MPCISRISTGLTRKPAPALPLYFSQRLGDFHPGVPGPRARPRQRPDGPWRVVEGGNGENGPTP